MRIFRSLTLMLILFVLVGCERSTETLQDLQGNKVDFAGYRGKWVVVNYWASWCDHCIKEIPELNAFYKAHKNKDAVVFGVNQDPSTIDKLPLLIDKVGIKFPVLTTNPAKMLGIGEIPGLPITYLINPEGKLQGPLLGEQTREGLENIMGLTAVIR